MMPNKFRPDVFCYSYPVDFKGKNYSFDFENSDSTEDDEVLNLALVGCH